MKLSDLKFDGYDQYRDDYIFITGFYTYISDKFEKEVNNTFKYNEYITIFNYKLVSFDNNQYGYFEYIKIMKQVVHHYKIILRKNKIKSFI